MKHRPLALPGLLFLLGLLLAACGDSPATPVASITSPAAPTVTAATTTAPTTQPAPATDTPAAPTTQPTPTDVPATPAPADTSAPAPQPAPAATAAPPNIAAATPIPATATPAPTDVPIIGASATATPPPPTPTAAPVASFDQTALSLLGAGWKIAHHGTIATPASRAYVVAYKPSTITLDPGLTRGDSGLLLVGSDAAIVQANTKGVAYIAFRATPHKITGANNLCLAATNAVAYTLNITMQYLGESGNPIPLSLVPIAANGTPAAQGMGAAWVERDQTYRLSAATGLLKPATCS